ncbi:MAG: DUF1622 domain-containing protein [Alkalilacustris sp.]
MDLIDRPSALRDHLPGLSGWLEWVAVGLEVFAILILLSGFARFVFYFLRGEMRWNTGLAGTREMAMARVVLARYILSALEVFIVADLILLVLTMSLANLLFLGLLVVIRTLISYFLEHEIRALEAKDW